MQAGDPPARGRIAIATGAALLLGGLIAIVLHLSVGEGAEDRVTPAADQRCVTSWNTDSAARAYGRHNFNSTTMRAR